MENQQPTTRNQPRLSYTIGDRVRLSAAGKARLRQMPEAWGMHAASARDEVGEVIEVIEGEDGGVIALSVEFESGSVYNWDVEQFEPA